MSSLSRSARGNRPSLFPLSLALAPVLLLLATTPACTRQEQPSASQSTVAMLPMHTERQDETDLELAGPWADGVTEPGTVRFVRLADLQKHPAVRAARGKIDFQNNRKAEITALPVAALLESAGLAGRGDLVLADCNDGYQSHYDTTQLATLEPVLVLAIEGAGAEVWGKRDGTWRFGPHFISILNEGSLTDPGSKRPFNLRRLTVTNWANRFSELTAGPRGAASGPVALGRELVRNHCLACHGTASGQAGGRLSNRSIEIVSAQAKYNRDYFEAMVRDPSSIMPGIAMVPHPHYTAEHYAALRAYLALW